MSKKILFFCTALLIVGPTDIAWASKSKLPTETAQTRIEVDASTGVIRFIINGQEKARLDIGGLQVNGSITYTDTISDIGAANKGKSDE